MTVLERHQDLVEELLAEVEAYKPDVDRELLTRAFDFAARAHADQVRRSGQEFIYHPWGVAKILAGLQLDVHQGHGLQSQVDIPLRGAHLFAILPMLDPSHLMGALYHLQTAILFGG